MLLEAIQGVKLEQLLEFHRLLHTGLTAVVMSALTTFMSHQNEIICAEARVHSVNQPAGEITKLLFLINLKWAAMRSSLAGMVHGGA